MYVCLRFDYVSNITLISVYTCLTIYTDLINRVNSAMCLDYLIWVFENLDY